jgi:hypothetical protein
MYHVEKDVFSFTMSSSPSPLIPSDKIPNENRMDTMPAAHLVDAFKIKYLGYVYKEMTSKGFSFHGYMPFGELFVQINKEMHNKQKQAWKKNEPDKYAEYMNADTRFALSSGAALEADRVLKVSKWNDAYEPALHKYFEYQEDKLAYECAQYWVEEYAKAKFYGPHTVEFVKAHKTSHPTPGITWNEVVRDKLMSSLWAITDEIANKWSEDFQETGDWCLAQEDIHHGNRQRSPDVDFVAWCKWIVTRTRQIGYATGVSSLNAFIEHKVKMRVMREIFNRYENVLDCKIVCPKTEGGVIYSMLRDYYLEGYQLVHFDVAGMEIITPSIIMGRTKRFDFGIGAVIGYIKQVPELLSGVSPTSDWDMIAHLEFLRYFFTLMDRKPLLIVILGDDCTMVFEHPPRFRKHPLYERQISDDKMVRTLGLTTSEFMHPVGRPITIDRADKRIPMRDNWDKWIRNSKTPIDRNIIMELFTGIINEVPVHEILESAPPVDYLYSPKDIVLSQLDLLEAEA